MVALVVLAVTHLGVPSPANKLELLIDVPEGIETELDPLPEQSEVRLPLVTSPVEFLPSSSIENVRLDMSVSLDRTIDFGAAPEVSFFGTQAHGRRIAFVVDNSNSMIGGRFETAVIELNRTIQELRPWQKFFIVLFSDTAYPQFHPRGIEEMIPATDENKRKVAYWLKNVQRCLRTDGLPAVQMAHALDPDVIYILSDGRFTDRTPQVLLRSPLQDVTIHTLGMGLRPGVVEQYRAIAEAHNGTFRDVGITPEGLKAAQRRKRPSNWTRGKVWGVELSETRRGGRNRGRFPGKRGR